MKKMFQLKPVLTLIVALFISGLSQAQEAKPVGSPRDSITAKAGNATITLNYGSPSVKGRKIWGELVPYGKIWRAGANEATTFTVDKDVLVEGKKLPAGTYSLFVIPTEKTWTVIFNKVVKQWGAYKHDQKEDALRVTVNPVKSATKHERLNYQVNTTGFTLNWDEITLPVSVK